MRCPFSRPGQSVRNRDLLLRGCQGEPHSECSPFANLAINLNTAAMCFGNGLRDGKSKSRTTLPGLPGLGRAEDLWNSFGKSASAMPGPKLFTSMRAQRSSAQSPIEIVPCSGEYLCALSIRLSSKC